MHIVYVSREYPPSRRAGGIATYLKIVAEGFAARGHKVTVIAANDDTSREQREVSNGIEVVRLAGGDFLIPGAEPSASRLARLRFLYRFHSYRRRVAAELRRIPDADVVEVAEYGAEGLYLNGTGVPVVYRLHTPALLDHSDFSLSKLSTANALYYYAGRKELDILRRHARFVTSCSSSLREWAVRHAGLDASRVQVIYNPLQPDFFHHDASVQPAEAPERPYVFFAGTICDWKGAADLVEAVGLLNREGLSVDLRMAGKSGAFGERLAAEHASDGWLHILGKLPQQELKALYRGAAVVCFPSWWENMPMVCLEAMSLGAIVVGSDSGGMAEIIEDGKSGYLLPPKRPEAWAAKIREAMALTAEQRASISEAARARISSVFSLDSILDSTERVYRDAIRQSAKH